MQLRRHVDQRPGDSGRSGEGGYLASASDLMIGLLFVFIILVVVLAVQQRKQQAEIDRQRAGLVGAQDPLIVVTQALGGEMKKMLPNVQINEKTGVISLPADVLFEVGEHRLSPSGRAALKLAADQLLGVMPCYVHNQRSGRDCAHNPYGHLIDTIFIEGHTDNRAYPLGGGDNFDLSLRRARAVERVLVQGSRLVEYRNKADQPLFSFSAYADTRPRPGTLPDADENRRVDLRIVLSYQPIENLIPGLKPGGAAASGS